MPIKESDERDIIYSMLDRLYDENYFREPKSFSQIYDELVRPSSTSSYALDRKKLAEALNLFVKKRKLARKGRMLDLMYSQTS